MYSLVIGFLSIIILPSLPAQQDVHAGLIQVEKRQAAPKFYLSNRDGKKIRLSDLRGKIVLLNFWATDCGGCVLEIPSFIELERIYGSPSFTALGVSMDISYENLKDANEAWKRVVPFVVKHDVNYPILMGDDAVSKDYALNAFPATYLIDKSGKVAATYVGVLIDKETVASNIRKLLSEK
jgi:peroxiredoxin